ncbi:DUF858-domain-containing protein [Jaminaea rosea]|uniref:Alpha N-terminal protein methyltransferase 1 n=1 Tax=Jaminaea rosea TaxID=1569628 RepID=A0A316UXS0_9BASI|nr:DUF858-domain-containing protein [Jaminaea rosea]PWN29091.1 DUF858-domain-containing protein [Jaminaea rosea]
MRKKQPAQPTVPDVVRGIDYWKTVPATVDGVLGGFGTGTLPRVDALGSRSFLLSVLPRLSAVPPVTDDPVEWQKRKMEQRGGKGKTVTRALDCGAGVGRVTETVLLRVVDEVHVTEPVEHFLAEAARLSSSWQSLTLPPSKQPFHARKAAHFHLSTLQALDPARPWSSADGGIYRPPIAPNPLQYDVVWCQWMLQHLSDPDLLAFFARAKASLVPEDGVIVVKENVCPEMEDGSERVWWDEEDKSITRSTQAYERVFREAGLTTIRAETQMGFPQELYAVKMWALR